MSATQIASFGALDVVETAGGAIFTIDATTHIPKVSTNDGASWSTVPGMGAVQCRAGTPLVNGLDEVLYGQILASNPHVYYCTSSASTDAGALTSATTAITRFTKDAAGVVYAMNDNDAVMHKSTDHGHSWSAFAPSLPATIGQVYACEANAYGLMVGGEIGKCYASSNGGTSWTDWGLSHPSSRAAADYHGNLWNIQTSPVTGTTFATIGCPDVPAPGNTKGALQRHASTDGVGVWSYVNGLGSTLTEDFSGLVWQADGSILAGCIFHNTGNPGRIYRSTDDGVNWTDVTSTYGTFVGSVRLHIGPSGRLYISDNNGIYRQSATSATSSNALFFGGGV